MKTLAVLAVAVLMAPNSCNPNDPSAPDVASWNDVAPGPSRQPTIVIDDSVYPDSAGVQFAINGEVDDRNPEARPNGYDATGPQEGSEYHVYPDVTLEPGDGISARWNDAGGTSHISVVVVDDAGAPPPLPSGDRPSAQSTGHDGNLTRTYGSTQITQTWLNQNNGGSRTVENVRFDGGVKVLVDNVTIRNFEVRGGKYGVDTNVFNGSVRGLTLEDGEITGSSSSGLLVANTIARRLNIHEMGADAIKPFGNVTIEDSYIHHLGTNDGAHADGIQARGGAGLVVTGNYFDMPTRLAGYENSICIILQNINGDLNDVLIEGNWFNGGGYTVNNGNAGNDRLIDNVFTREHLFGPLTGAGSWNVKSGNTYDDGTPI